MRQTQKMLNVTRDKVFVTYNKKVMLNPRITSILPKPIVAKESRLFFVPDFKAESLLYNEFGMNNEIDIVRNNPQYDGVVNNHLREISDYGVVDMSDLSDEEKIQGVETVGLYDENETVEYLSMHRKTYDDELRKIREPKTN